MSKQSKLFEIILARCAKEGENPSVKKVSANRFLAETLKILSQSEDKNRADFGGDEEILREIGALKVIFGDLHVDFSAAASGMSKYVDEGKENFFDGLLFSKIMTEFEMAAAKEGGAGMITADAVCRKLLAQPTEAVTRFVLHPEKSGAPRIQPPPEAKKEGSANAGATIKRLFGKAVDEEEQDEERDKPSEKSEAQKQFSMSELVEKTNYIQSYLAERVYGQDHAVNTFAAGYFQAELTAATQTDRVKPKATFLFAGPPGTGKTFLSVQAAKALKLPFKRFDMSEYASAETTREFAGSAQRFAGANEGNVTGFVSRNPECVLLFDEIEKSSLAIIHLFLQILDAGRLRDENTNKEVSFKDAIIILTTNAGRRMYEDESINLQTASRKSILKALAAERNPLTDAPMFPAAICSRFDAGNVIMFNRMEAGNLISISRGEIDRNVKGIESSLNVSIEVDDRVPHAIIFREGGKTDARAVSGKSANFVYEELYELFRLLNSESNGYDVNDLKKIKIGLQLPDDKKVASLFSRESRAGVLLFAEKDKAEACKRAITSADVYTADTVERAKELLACEDISVVICDLTCNARGGDKVLNIEDCDSEGRNLFYYIVERFNTPVYVLEDKEGQISREDWQSLAKSGALGRIYVNGGEGYSLDGEVYKITDKLWQQKNLFNLARANKALNFKTLQKVTPDGAVADIVLYDFKLVTAVDAEDSGNVLDSVSKPNVNFADVIGAQDAKEELSCFIDYLKNPAKYVRMGVKAPKGILLYGPPGTGKTLLAKALAGEADVTFIKAEGNQFLKKYVGEGPQAVHDLFSVARKYAPAVLFIDEIDAIAKTRGGEREASDDVLTSFLTEMDGFNTDKDRPVFVLAATNFEVEQGKARSLDAALLRRFDRRIYVDLPNKEERLQFIKMKAGKITNHSLTEEQMNNLAVRSTGSSLADLDSVFELALRNVLKFKEYTLTDKILEDAFETFNSGEIKKWAEGELLCTARHEAGHATMCWLGGEIPAYLTVVARGDHGGYMQNNPEENKGSYTKDELLAIVRTALAGRAAEVIYYGDRDGASTGASGDLRQATGIIKSMICDYGMDEVIGLGSVNLNEIVGSPYYSQIMTRVNEILKEQFAITKEALSKNRAAIDALVEELLNKNALKGDEIDAILSKTAKR